MKTWKRKGQATRNFATDLTATGREAAAAASVADSRCQPVNGAARYASENTYSDPENMVPVIRVQIDAPSQMCE